MAQGEALRQARREPILGLCPTRLTRRLVQAYAQKLNLVQPATTTTKAPCDLPENRRSPASESGRPASHPNAPPPTTTCRAASSVNSRRWRLPKPALEARPRAPRSQGPEIEGMLIGDRTPSRYRSRSHQLGGQLPMHLLGGECARALRIPAKGRANSCARRAIPARPPCGPTLGPRPIAPQAAGGLGRGPRAPPGFGLVGWPCGWRRR